MDYYDSLKSKMDHYVKMVYRITKSFPLEERFGLTSQLRRSALSVMLNFIEGYARFRPAIKLNFYEISYGSLKESKYIIYLSYFEKLILEKEYKDLINLSEEIGKMIWKIIRPLQSN